jgi:transposase-like protein
MAIAKKLCKLAKKEKFDEIGALARTARFICHKCGRTAENSENLCQPRKLKAEE